VGRLRSCFTLVALLAAADPAHVASQWEVLLEAGFSASVQVRAKDSRKGAKEGRGCCGMARDRAQEHCAGRRGFGWVCSWVKDRCQQLHAGLLSSALSQHLAPAHTKRSRIIVN
jgi:hypothetical protein